MSDLMRAIAHSKFNPTQEIRTLASPSAGADLVIPATNGQDWRLLGVRATLVTSAAVANRTVTAVIDDQTTIGAQMATGVTQAASTTTVYSWVADLSFAPAAVTAGVLTLTMPYTILPTGWRFRTITNLIDVADQWSGVSIFIERLDEPPWRDPLVGTALDAEVQHDIQQAIAEGM